MKKIRIINISIFKKFIFEFLSIFFAVVFAFLLNNWNEDRKDKIVENKILLEIYNGLGRDSMDLASDEKFILKNYHHQLIFHQTFLDLQSCLESFRST